MYFYSWLIVYSDLCCFFVFFLLIIVLLSLLTNKVEYIIAAQKLRQWLKCNGTHYEGRPPPLIYGLKRSQPENISVLERGTQPGTGAKPECAVSTPLHSKLDFDVAAM